MPKRMILDEYTLVLIEFNETHYLYFQQEYQNFHFTPVLSKPDTNWDGANGYVQQVIDNSIDTLGDLNQIQFYLCGPKQMMLETISMLKKHGVKDSAILCDDFSN